MSPSVRPTVRRKSGTNFFSSLPLSLSVLWASKSPTRLSKRREKLLEFVQPPAMAANRTLYYFLYTA